jgi:hypothetical protein
MNFEPDIADDCLLVDGLETITLHGTATLVVEGARRGRLTLAQMEFRQVGLESTDMAWALPAVSLGDVVPCQGDVIEDAGATNWIILSASHAPLTAVWRVVTRRQL